MSFDISALRQLAATAGVPADDVATIVRSALRDALAVARGTADDLTIDVDPDSGTVTVIDASGAPVPTDNLGARATLAARQAVVSWLRDRDRVRKVGPWAKREGTPIRAVVKHVARNGDVRLDAQGTAAVMPAGEAISGEELHPGTEVTVLLLNANVTDRDTVRLTVSRRQPALVTALFARHLDGTGTTIRSVAREPGVRTKVAYSGDLADLVGPAGTIVRSVTADLDGEKVDLIATSDDPATFAAAALSPAKTISATVTDPSRRTVTVEVAPDQMALAYGTGGVNLRLACKLTGTRIQLVPTTAAAQAA